MRGILSEAISSNGSWPKVPSRFQHSKKVKGRVERRDTFAVNSEKHQEVNLTVLRTEPMSPPSTAQLCPAYGAGPPVIGCLQSATGYKGTSQVYFKPTRVRNLLVCQGYTGTQFHRTARDALSEAGRGVLDLSDRPLPAGARAAFGERPGRTSKVVGKHLRPVDPGFISPCLLL